MRNHFCFSLIIGINLFAFLPPSFRAFEEFQDSEKVFSELHSLIQEKTDSELFSGAVLIAHEDKPLFKKAYGVASRRYSAPNQLDTKFNLGSMNKMFTAVAIAQLAENKKLDYEDTINHYLDESWVPTRIAEKVRIRHLLTHSSGFGDFFNDIFWQTPRDFYKSVDDYKALKVGEKILFEPGAKWSYSNFGFILLGAIIERITQESYSDYVKQHIYLPSGMENTGEYDMEEPVPNLAIGYQKIESDRNGLHWESNLFKHLIQGGPAGGGFSTVEDLFQFSKALKSNRLMAKETRELLWSKKIDTGFQDTRWGYGFIIRQDPQLGKMIGHSGGFFGISSVFWIYPETGFTITILSNYGDGVEAILEDVRQAVIHLNH